jgi:DNA-binding IclR family transcriptional regulator
MCNMNRKGIIQSLDRGLVILDYLAENGEECSLAEITRFAGIDRSSVFRLLSTLEAREYVYQNGKTKAYSLGPRIRQLNAVLCSNTRLEDVAKPFLKELRSKTGESAHLAVHFQWQATFVGCQTSEEVLSVNTQIGRREPLHCTALGKALLACFPGDMLSSYLKENKLARFTPKTITSRRMLCSELEKVRSRGYVTDDEEYKPGVRCIAAPVFNEDGEGVAAIGVSGPSSRFLTRDLTSVGEIVKDVASRLSCSLGWRRQ